MRKIILLSLVLCSSCSDEFEVRTQIDGAWRIESIQWVSEPPPGQPMLARIDSVVSTADASMSFTPCSRKTNNHSLCDAAVSLLGMDLLFHYNVRGGNIFFSIPFASRKYTGDLETKIDELFTLGDNLTVRWNGKNEVNLEKASFLNLSGQPPLRPANVKLRLTRKK